MADAPGRYLSFDPVAGDYDQTRVIPGPQLEEIARILAREATWSAAGCFWMPGWGRGGLPRRWRGVIRGRSSAWTSRRP